MVYGRRPNELMVKRLGMVGCSALVLVHSIKDNKKLSSYAGELHFAMYRPECSCGSGKIKTCFCAFQVLYCIKMIMHQGVESLLPYYWDVFC